MADKKDIPGQKALVTLSEAMGNPPTPVNVPPPAKAPAHPDAMVKEELSAPKGGYPEEKKRWFNLGVLKGCPHQTVHVGISRHLVATFTLAAETVMLNRESRQTERSKRRGDFMRLSDEEHKILVERVKDRVIRWTNRASGRGFIINTKDVTYPDKTGYQQEQGDEALGKYLFLKEIAADAVEAILNPMGGEAQSMAAVTAPA
jgi:hypothetical protein